MSTTRAKRTHLLSLVGHHGVCNITHGKKITVTHQSDLVDCEVCKAMMETPCYNPQQTNLFSKE